MTSFLAKHDGRPVAYRVGKSPEIWDALVQGFGAFDRPAAGPGLDPRGQAILGGLDFGSARILREARRLGHPYVFVDNGYLGTHERGKRVRYRVVPNAYGHHWVNPHRVDAAALARAERCGVRLQPWRKTGSHVLVCLSSAVHADFFGLKGWEASIAAEIRRHTDRPVIVRSKGEILPLAEQLKDCWAVVAWSSKCAVDAILAGVPAFVGPESPALPVALPVDVLDRIEDPERGPRHAWLASLAWGQFTRDEIASGLAAELCREWDFVRQNRVAA